MQTSRVFCFNLSVHPANSSRLYYLIAGEASGDLHGANLMRSIRRLDPQARFRFWGGDRMEAEGGVNVNHIRERAFMGFGEVLKNLFRIRKLLREAKEDILRETPHRLIFIDYPGFNLRIADWAHEQGIITHYYISPKVWAWNTRRALKIKRIINHLYVILPFEVEFYKRYQYEVHYVGNPLMDAIESFVPDPGFKASAGLDKRPVIALLPGSRKQEIDAILPLMLQGVREFQEQYEIVIAVAPDFDLAYYQKFPGMDKLKMVTGNTYDLLKISEAALVTSGTATLETALLGIPQVVCYKTSAFNFALAKRLIKVPFISLVNLIAGREMVKELIQSELSPGQIKNQLGPLLKGPKREKMLEDYEDLKQIVGPGGASHRTAEWIVKG